MTTMSHTSSTECGCRRQSIPNASRLSAQTLDTMVTIAGV